MPLVLMLLIVLDGGTKNTLRAKANLNSKSPSINLIQPAS